MGFVESGALRLWAERIGDPGDPPVLLITGAMAQSVNWPDVFVDRLVAGGRQVIRYDHRDTGLSDSVDFDEKPYTLADLAWDALAVLDGFGIGAAHLVGASMGGVIAQGLASLQPERVLTLTAMNTTPIDGGDDLPPSDAAFLRKIKEAEDLPRDTAEQRVAADLVIYEAMNGTELPYDRAAARELAERYFARAKDWTTAANHLRAGGEQPDHLPATTAPTLVIGATADPIFPLPHSAAVAARIPGARLIEIPGMGHHMYSPGLPEQIADLILEHTKV
jgi:pimeloyl-ACP methyl ester carboxylesterase